MALTAKTVFSVGENRVSAGSGRGAGSEISWEMVAGWGFARSTPPAPESVPVLTDQRSLPHRWPKAATVNKPVNTETTAIFFKVFDTIASHCPVEIETWNKSSAT